MKNVWILTEERPKASTIKTIIEKIATDNGFSVDVKEGLAILPIMKAGCFSFTYEVTGVSSKEFRSVFIKIVSGSSSFVDYLIFFQEDQPSQGSKPLYAIEETKTDDSESRNTGIYQRCTKFVYIEFFYPHVKKIMLYDLKVKQKEKPTDTNIFGMRMLSTVGVEVLGKIYNQEMIKPFDTLEQLVSAKNAMKLPRSTKNVPIRMEVLPDRINISGRLYKAGGIGHDPNIGALTMIALCVRKWEPYKAIVITRHGLSQTNLGMDNKFIQIANKIGIDLDGLNLPIPGKKTEYWHYDYKQEKLATIFLHLALIAFTDAKIIYSNHGGAEREYFLHPEGHLVIEKYQKGKRAQYKAGDKTMIIYIPDMIIFDERRGQVINVEGKTYNARKQGIRELKNYTYIEKNIIKPMYQPRSILRTVVVFGSQMKTIQERQISFMLNNDGALILTKNAPEIIKTAITGALDLKHV